MTRQLILEVDEATARELDTVAPSRARKRSDFLRQALRRALDVAQEQRMKEAYARQPDDAEAFFDPEAWETRPARPGKRRP